MNRLDICIRRTMGFLSFSYHMAPTTVSDEWSHMTAVTLLLPDEFRIRRVFATRAESANAITPPLFSQPEPSYCHFNARHMSEEPSIVPYKRARRRRLLSVCLSR